MFNPTILHKHTYVYVFPIYTLAVSTNIDILAHIEKLNVNISSIT